MTEATIRDVTRLCACSLLAASLNACGGAAPARTTVAVLPVVWRTADPVEALDERAPLVDGMREVETVDVRTPNPSPPCDAEDSECARRVGTDEGAEHVLSISMAALGDTVLTRATLVDVGGGTAEQTRQRVVRSADEASLRAALRDLGLGVARPFAPEGSDGVLEATLATTAVVVVLAGVALAIGLSLADQGGPDFEVTPP